MKIRDRVKRLARVKASELLPHPANWRRHPEGQRTAVREMLESVGFAGACLVRETEHGLQLLDGHLRTDMAGDQKIPVLVLDVTEEEAKKLLAAYDPLGDLAEMDGEALRGLLDSLGDQEGEVGRLLASLVVDVDIPVVEEVAAADDRRELPSHAVPERVAGAGVGVGTSRPSPLAFALPSPMSATPVEDVLDEVVDEDDLDSLFKSPYPYFGGKSRVAGAVWRRFGDVGCYLEPFFGSGAVLLARPEAAEGGWGRETINDLCGMVSNFWRAVQQQPDEVAKYADWPVLENDLHARHAWLVERKQSMQERLEGDPDYCDVKAAGWWCWGMACWIGSGFCTGEGPWQVVTGEDGIRQLVHLGNDGRGVNRQRVHLSNDGRGVNRKRVDLSGDGRGGLLEWMRALSRRLQRVRVCCGDWTRVCGGRSGDALQHLFVGNKPCGVFFDPPYSAEAGRDPTLYAKEDLTVAHAVREWCIAHGNDTRLRIALCGCEGEHAMPAGWRCLAWKAAGGMAGLSDGFTAGVANRHRERVWFSPHCVQV